MSEKWYEKWHNQPNEWDEDKPKVEEIEELEEEEIEEES